QNANTEIAKDYISKRKIPELFESLLTGLMVHKPDDHIDFIIDSLARYKSENQALKWDLFIGHKGGVQTLAPLKKGNAQNHDQPSTSQQQQQQSMSYTTTNGKSEHDVGGGLNRRAKLDSIPAGKHDTQKETKKVSIDTQRLKDKKLILVIGGPGSGKRTQSEKIAQKYNYIHISTADLIKSDSQSKDFPAVYDYLYLVGEKMMTTADHTSGYVIDSQPNETRFGVTFERRVRKNKLI
ncbi:unnamed protein product, partial [Didymodactylos carnosus]